MIEWMSSWAEQIIVAVIICTIIEMILPSGNNKKYIKAIIGVYILFTIISPVISKFTNKNLNNIDFDYEKYFENTDTYQNMSQTLSNSNDKNVEEIYQNNLKSDMKNKLLEKGYIATNIKVKIFIENENNYGKIDNISLNITKKKENEDTQINIDKSNVINEIAINSVEKVDTQVNKQENTNNNIDQAQKEGENNISNSEINDIKQYLSNIYDVNKKNIEINKKGG